jgi:hypothetical protein
MAAVACRLEDVSNMPDPMTNERLHKARRLLCITLKQQAESLASQRRAAPSRPSKTMATINGDHSDLCAPSMGGDSDGTSGNSSEHPWTRGAKPQEHRRHELSSRRPPTCNWIHDNRDVRDPIEARHHAQAQSCTPKRWEGSPVQDHFGPLAFGARIRVTSYPR